MDSDGDTRPALEHVLGGDLGLRVWARPPQRAVTPQVRDLLVHLVRQLQGEGHALGGLVTSVAEHETLQITSVKYWSLSAQEQYVMQTDIADPKQVPIPL